MVVKFLSKYVLEVVPSIVATVVGAYIVTHYINAKPDADKAKTEVSAPAAAKGDIMIDKKPAVAEKPPAERPAVERAEKADKGDKSTEPASAASEARRQPFLKDFLKSKTAKTNPAANHATAPVRDAASDDNRDANEIARAAIERLRNADGSTKPAEPPRVQEAARTPETTRTEPPRAVQERSRVNVGYAPAIQPSQVQPSPSQPSAVQPVAIQSAPALVPPLPPAAAVMPSPSDTPAVSIAASPSFAGTGRANDLLPRLTPPAEIPSRPLDLHAASKDPSKDTSVAEDVVSAAKSVFKAVVPQ